MALLPNNGWWGGTYFDNYFGNDYWPDAPGAVVLIPSTSRGRRGLPSRIFENSLRVSKQGINALRTSRTKINRMR